ncbi:MAG: HYC_CC_PP family protein [Bacteroidota bacterium]
MKIYLKHIASVSMALLVLFSTMSFTINSHYCGSILVDKAVMKAAKTCAMHSSKMSHSDLEKDDCCSSEVEIVEGQSELLSQNIAVDFFPNFVFFTIPELKYNFPVVFDTQETIRFVNYIPPPLIKDLQLFDQVFLI